MDPTLIEDTYRVFAKYPKKVTPMVASWSSELALCKRVKATRLRALSCQDVASVWFNATGDERSVKHFLPRALECVKCGDLLIDDIRWKLGRLAVDTWPADEREIVAAIMRDTML
jgi:hypothetical protein